MTPSNQWPQVSRTLAQLQSIIRVQVSQEADIATAALSLANSATVLPPDNSVNTGGTGSSSDYDDAIAASPVATSTYDLSDADDDAESGLNGSADAGGTPGGQAAVAWGAQEAAQSQPYPTVDRPGGRRRDERFLSKPARPAPQEGGVQGAGGASAAGGGPQEGLQLGWFAWRVAHGPLTHAEACALDALLMRQVMALACQAHYGGAAPRPATAALTQRRLLPCCLL